MNFTPTDWDREADVVLDAKAAHSRFRSSEQQHDLLDQAEDREQNQGYGLVASIAENSNDPDSRRKARQALSRFSRSEEMEAQKDEAHEAGVGHVDRADEHLTLALKIAEPHRTPNQVKGDAT